MYIPSYQIHNVLNVYRRQLSRGKLPVKNQSSEAKEPMDTIEISTQGKRKSVMEKVATDIVNKITTYGQSSKSEFQNELMNRIHKDQSTLVQERNENPKQHDFEYNVIDQHNRKISGSLSTLDSQVLINRLEQLAKQAVEEPEGS